MMESLENQSIENKVNTLKFAQDVYYKQGYYARFLEIKMRAFLLLVNEEEIERAYEWADFTNVTLSKVQKKVPLELTAYYGKLLIFSVRNQHFAKGRSLLLHSLDYIETSTRADSVFLFSNLRFTGLINRYLGEYDESNVYLQKSLNLGISIFGKDHKNLANPFYDIGVNANIIGDFEKGLEYIVKAMNIKRLYYCDDNISFKSEFNALGLVYEGLGEYDLALSYHEKTIDIKKKHSDGFNSELGRSYLNLGTLLITMGQPQLAYQKSIFAINEMEENGSKDTEKFIWLYNNVGTSLNDLDRPLEAIPYLQKGLGLNKNKFDLSIDASLEHNLGIALLKTNAYDEAIDYFLSSKEKFIKDSPIHQRIAELDIALSMCYFQKKQFKIAEDYAFESIDRIQNKLPKTHPMLFQPYYELGRIYNKKGNYDKAITFVEKLDSLEYVPSLSLLKILNLKLEIYQEQDDKKFDLIKAKGNSLISETLKKYLPSEERYLLSKEIKRYYNICLENWKPFSDSTDKLELINIFNRSKNSILKAGVMSNQLKTYADIPTDLTNREFEWAKKIKYLENRIVYNQDPSNKESSSLSISKLEDLQGNYGMLLDTFMRDYPKYFELKFNEEESNVLEMSKLVDENTIVLDFFKGDHFYWILSMYNGEINLAKKRIDKQLSDNLIEFKQALADYNTILNEDSISVVFDRFVVLSSHIYENLLKEPLDRFPENINSIIVIPDGILNFIPFETLLQSKKDIESRDYRKLDYLIRKFNVSYAYSLSLLNNGSEEKGKNKFNYAGFSPKYRFDTSQLIDQDIILNDLPEARKSVKQSSELFDGESFISELATKKNFLLHSNESSILHLAMHCIVNNDNPMDTKLLFGSTSSNESDFLQSSDLYNTKLNNQLSVLNACNTGVGNLREGEGVISLSRAFTYAGSSSLMMSLWNVPDIQTASIVESFFQGLKDGKPKNVALNIAKRDYLSDAPKSASHPLFWAGFIITGNTEPLVLSSAWSTWYLMIPVGIFVLMFLYWKKTKR